MKTATQEVQVIDQEQVHTVLANRLSHFGLDPKDWRLEAQTTERWEIQNIHENDFSLIGWVRKFQGAWDWQTIELAGR